MRMSDGICGDPARHLCPSVAAEAGASPNLIGETSPPTAAGPFSSTDERSGFSQFPERELPSSAHNSPSEAMRQLFASGLWLEATPLSLSHLNF